MHPIKRFYITILVICGLLFPLSAMAQPSLDYTAFSQIPISHQGRVKPLGRVAQLTLYQMAQIDLSIPQASAWLASLLFDPQKAEQVAIFQISNPHLLHALQLERPHRSNSDSVFYDFQTLDHAFTQQADLIISLRELPENTLQKDQQELLVLYAQVTWYEQLKNAMTLLLPLTEPAGKRFIDLPQTSSPNRIHNLIAAQGTMNISFRVIPVHHHTQQLVWMSPWEYWLQRDTLPDNDNAQLIPLLNDWAQLAQAYIHHDNTAWHQTAMQILDKTVAQTGQTFLASQLKADLLYHVINPYFLSLCFYFGAFIMALVTLRSARPIFYRMTLFLFSGGIICHLFGLVCRVFILQRPPVSNLYESILFVGALLGVTGIWYIHHKREKLLFPALALTIMALQLLGFVLNNEGDSLQVLQAVLDTKFWLAVHVMTITTGYALCLVTALLAHAALFLSAKNPNLTLYSHRFYKRAFYFSLLSLLFVSIGTLLGGVWADQSWGRFWGWDPKENGALLIVLWIVWLLHGRISHHLSDRTFIIGLAALNIIVGISWIGVNLLGIGLHAYGFINGSALSLIILVLAECIFFALCGFLYLRKRGRHA